MDKRRCDRQIRMTGRAARRFLSFVLLFLTLGCGLLLISTPAGSEMVSLTDKELDEIHGRQGFSEFTIDNNSVRVFFDIHVETYQRIDSFKLGYYPKSDSGIKDSGYVFTDADSFNTVKYPAVGSPEVNNEYSYVEIFNGFITAFKGQQGSSSDNKNRNFHDWDINWENVQMGKSPEEPMIIDGLVFRVDFDDFDSPNRKIKRIILGTNNQRGYFAADMLRSTGLFNPLNTDDFLARIAGNKNPADGHPVLLKRDSMLTNWDHYVFNEGDNDMGFWLICNLIPNGPNGETDHIGWEVITGYDERAVDFSYTSGIDNLDLSGYR